MLFLLDARAQGCNQLIRDGATLVQSAADVMEAIRPFEGRVESAPVPYESPEALVDGDDAATLRHITPIPAAEGASDFEVLDRIVVAVPEREGDERGGDADDQGQRLGRIALIDHRDVRGRDVHRLLVLNVLDLLILTELRRERRFANGGREGGDGSSPARGWRRDSEASRSSRTEGGAVR